MQRRDLLVGILATTGSATLVAMWAAGLSLLANIALLLPPMTALAFALPWSRSRTANSGFVWSWLD
ncbi:MAG TPA: hypothetical protein VHT01_08970 [Candidatus Udaeobacter sp.]|nr:hypothetical protein [Candidatus Udaeobacter sp.]